MANILRRCVLALVVAGVAAAPVFCQETQKPGAGGAGFGFNMGIGIGVQSFNEPDPYIDGATSVTYQSIGLTPDISFGKFGIGLAVMLNYRFVAGGQVVVRAADWVPTSFQNFLEIYLPKIMYVRWGLKGDPLFVKAGSMDDLTLGTGFIMSNYANTLFLPTTRVFGLSFDLDGALFNFPYVGLETVVGNLATFDVVGGRLYVRPLVGTDIPILKNLQVGGTVVADTGTANAIGAAPAAPFAVFGADFILPIISNPAVSLATFGDVDSIAGKSFGGELGVGGKLIGFLTYGAQLRVLGSNFIPSYFGATYDLFRTKEYESAFASSGAATVVGWYASIGTSFFDDKIIFNVGLDGPFGTPYPMASPTDPAFVQNYPHLRGIFTIAQGIVPGISFDFVYDKKGINSLQSLVSAENAAIQAQLNFKTGPAVLSFVYMVRYAPGQSPDWITTSGIQSAIQLF